MGRLLLPGTLLAIALLPEDAHAATALDGASMGESHLRRVLASYSAYYNKARTHLALQKDAPSHRSVQRSGAIAAIPVLAGLHHRYVWI